MKKLLIKTLLKKHLFPLLAVIVTACLLFFLEGDFLWKVQEQNLFLCTRLFFNEQMVVPGGFLTWLGTFFTQFLYHPWLGLTLLGAWWLLLMWLIARTFKVYAAYTQTPRGWVWLAGGCLVLIPVLLILVTIVDMGYWVYVLKLRGHFFVTTIGATVVTALLWGFRQTHAFLGTRLPVVIAVVVLTCAVGYPLFGVYGLAATLLMGVWSWHLEPRRWKALAVSAVAVLSIVIVPLLCYRYVYCQTNLDNIYFAELPLYFIREEHHLFYVPFYLLLLYFTAMVLFSSPGSKAWKRRPLLRLSPVALLVGTIVYTACNWYHDENFERELAMEHCIERLDWEGVLREAAAQRDEPTRAIVVMRNIALARLGRQSNEMYRYKNGSKRSNAPFDMRMMMVNGPLVYYHYGMVNGCNRLCIEMGVEYDWRAEHLKYMARCAILNGEWQLARKFLGLLKHTIFFADWAERLSRLVGSDKAGSTPEMGFITHMMHYQSEITSDHGYTELFIMKRLSASTYAADPIFQEQALLASLFTKDVPQFWRHLVNYVNLHPDEQLPRHIQEAAILFGTLENRKNLDTWPFDDSVKESYRLFREVTPRYQNMEVDAVRKALAPQFGHTYYYDYYLMNNLPQY